MISSILPKVKIYPLASTAIASLIGFIVLFETGVIFPISHENSTAGIQTAQVESPETDDHNNSQRPISAEQSPEYIALELDAIEQKQVDNTHKSVVGFDPKLAALLANGEFAQLREELLKLAAVAVSDNDKNRLGYILNLLGQISIQEQDLYSAEVYLAEALDIFRNLEDEIGSAQVYLQLGRTHLKSRQIARVAGTAYDELQVGRWYLNHGLLNIAEEYIVNSIENNLSINRYGSAASAYESLGKLYLQLDDYEQATAAVFKSARMFSASGQKYRAKQVLKLMPQSERDNNELTQLSGEIESNYQNYKDSILQIERAKDYKRLYRYYRNTGDQERAWKFRLLANNSLGEISKRALFHRQQGVLAILYNSNDAMDLAEDYFVQAKQTFDNNGLVELSDETDQLNRQVY